MRKMSLDLGDRRIGIALSDLMGIIASGYETYTRCGDAEKDLQYIVSLIKEKQVDTVVLGLPVNMDVTEGERALLSREFGEKLKALVDVKVDFLDERLTTVSAEKLLISADVRREKRKTVIDKIAATIILQDYLDMHSR